MRVLIAEVIHISLELLDCNLIRTFQIKVLLADYNVPRGWITTYQRLAIHLGNPNGTREIGNALRNNSFPIIIPCHRAIQSDGKLGGFQGGISMKRALLEMQGIEFSAEGKVIAKTRSHWLMIRIVLREKATLKKIWSNDRTNPAEWSLRRYLLGINSTLDKKKSKWRLNILLPPRMEIA